MPVSQDKSSVLTFGHAMPWQLIRNSTCLQFAASMMQSGSWCQFSTTPGSSVPPRWLLSTLSWLPAMSSTSKTRRSSSSTHKMPCPTGTLGGVTWLRTAPFEGCAKRELCCAAVLLAGIGCVVLEFMRVVHRDGEVRSLPSPRSNPTERLH